MYILKYSDYLVPVHDPVNKPTNQCTLQPCTAMYSYLQPIFNAHCSTLQPSTAYSQASSAHPVHILQQPLHLQCTYYSSHCIFSAHTTAAIASSVHILQQPLAIFSAHCNHVQPCTAICSQSSMHTAANCSHLQPPTLQLYHPVHTTAIPSSAHYSHTT